MSGTEKNWKKRANKILLARKGIRKNYTGRNEMKKNKTAIGILLVLALAGLMVLSACDVSESQMKTSSGYDDYIQTVERVEDSRDLDTCSVTKEGFIKIMKEAEKNARPEAIDDGDATEEDFKNFHKVMKKFEKEYDEYVDPDDYTIDSFYSEPIDDADHDRDYQSGVISAQQDLKEYIEANGPFVKFDAAREWVSEEMTDLDSEDLFEDINYAVDYVAQDTEGCWLETGKIKQDSDEE